MSGKDLGWHYSVSKGVATIHVYQEWVKGKRIVSGYWADILSAKQFIADAKDPEDALGFAIQDARGAALKIESDLAALADV